jgi:hypothetical protein
MIGEKTEEREGWWGCDLSMIVSWRLKKKQNP